MDSILISVLYAQINQGNKGEGDWKPQAYHVVVVELNSKLGLRVNSSHVRHKVKLWKKHHTIINEIRSTTKFNWDDKSKMLVITVDELPDWVKYCEENPDAKAYQNKPIENWDDIYVLVGPDRANGEDAEQVEESAIAMDVENEGGCSSKEVPASSGSNKKLKRDCLADAVTSFAESFRQYVIARQAILQPAPARLSGKEIHSVVELVPSILEYQILRVIKHFMSSPDEFQMLMDLPDDKKLDWVLLCLAD